MWQIPRESERGAPRAPGRASIVAAALLLAGSAGCGGVRTGDSAPDFTLPDASGASVSLGDHYGKVVLLSFWATWCGPCRMELPELTKLRAELGDDVVLLLVSDEPSGKTTPFLRNNRIEATALQDASQGVFRTYGISGLPTLFLIDGRGVVRQSYEGYRPGQTEEIRDRVAELLKG